MRKSHILYTVIISILSLMYIDNSVSALDYSSNIGVGFTFNPTLSISLSSADLVISNLTPGTTEDSDSINISVSTNAAYGYTLSATTNSNNLIHNDNNVGSVFSSIATNADLISLDNSEDNNIWGYTSKLSNEVAWNNYNGLSSSSSTVLLDSNNKSSNVEGNNSGSGNGNGNSNGSSNNSIDFKISAKASSAQPSGTYTGVVNFIAVSKVAPMSLLDSFIASGAEQLNGYYKMQDMAHDICESVDIEESELQLIDIRDNKIYWVAKLKDGNCWMTQNLDLDLSSTTALTSETSDIDPESYGNTIYTVDTGYSRDEETGVVAWLPERNTYTSISAPGTDNWAGDTGDNTTSGYYHPYSWNRIDNNGKPVYPDSIVTKAVAGNHAQSGNYYNWSAAVASNNSLDATGSQKNSICPRNWRLPINGEYGTLYSRYKTAKNNNNAFGLMASPLWLIRPGTISNGGSLNGQDNIGVYWSNTINGKFYSYNLTLWSNRVLTGNFSHRYQGMSTRCVSK